MPKRPSRIPRLIGFVLMLAVVWGLSIWLGLNKTDYRQVGSDLLEYGKQFSSPKWSVLPECLAQTGVTLATAFTGTVLSFLAALILLPFTLKTLHPIAGSRPFVRSIFVFLRSIPDGVFVVILIMCVGVGPQGAALALALHMTGFVGKSLHDTVDRLPEQQLQGVKACGATRLQTFTFGVLPNVLPEIGNLALYSLDRNFRMAAVLGVLGAGGIGLTLKISLDSFHYPQAGTALVILLVSVWLLDALSNRLSHCLAQ